MQDIYLSLNNNILRISTLNKDGLKLISQTLPSEMVSDTKLLDVPGFSAEVKKVIGQITGQSVPKVAINVVVEPEDIILRFITANKKDGDRQEQLINDIKTKVTDVPLEDVYFSYQKIAPFLYQFVAVKKDYMDNILKVANELGASLKSVVSWISILPKYLSINEPAVFICRIDGSHAVALSELGGIFYSDVSNKKITEQQLQSFVSDLSLYKKRTPIKKIYTLNYQDFDAQGYEVIEIGMPPIFAENEEGYKPLVLMNYMQDSDPSVLGSQNNLLNLMPLPVVENKKTSLVYVGVGVATLLLSGALSFLLFFNKNRQTSEVSSSSGQTQNVLSEQSENVKNEKSENEVKPLELKRESLKVKVLNGANVNGLAAKTKSLFEVKGYKVVDIDTAEESRSDTLYRFNKDSLQFRDLVTSDFTEQFPKVSVEDTLPVTEPYDLLIIVGTENSL